MIRGLDGLADLLRFRPTSQSNEDVILEGLADSLPFPRTFVEFGFGPLELNCGRLIRRGFGGILIDGAGGHAMTFLRWRLKPLRVDVLRRFLTVENIGFLRERFACGELGVLSVDVDGNDYWFLRELLPVQPAVVVVEYNASFGPTRRVTVPYDASFNRHEKHPSGLYHGASLTALTALCPEYGLFAVSDAGTNAVFVRSDLGCEALDPVQAWRENTLRNAYSGTTAVDQWDAIRDLPLVEV